MRRVAISVLIVTVASLLAYAKDQPFQVVSWPGSGQPVLRFTFSKFNSIGSGVGKERTYVTDVTAENLSNKTITGTSFSLYVFDKSKVRIAEGYINLTDVAAGQTVRFQVTISASGSPNSV
ncbi:MAG: FxLYD domain-containing protein, partial [Candidatus Sulfotelmatobacter sp.]